MKREKFAYVCLYSLLKMVALLPLRALYLVSDFLCFLAYRVVGYRREVVSANLRNSFPEKSEKELEEIAREFYRFLTDSIVETIKLLHISDRQMRHRVRVTNPEVIEEMATKTPDIILFLGHYCNWEWVPGLMLSVPRPSIMGSLYSPLHNRVMDRIMLRLRTRHNLLCIPAEKAYRELLAMRAEGRDFMIGFIADQRPPKPYRHFTEFLGQSTPFMAGGETIGKRIGAGFVYLDIRRERRGYYTLTFVPMEVAPDDTEDYPYSRLFFRLLEGSIRRAPAYWLWSHRRWE